MRGRQGGGRDRDRRHGLPRRRRRLAASTRSSPTCSTRTCEFVVQEEWTEYTGVPRAGRATRRCFVGMHAMDGTPERRAEPHRLGHATGRTSGSTARSSARRGSTPRSAAPGAARCCSSPATRRRAARAPRCSATASRRSTVKRGSAVSLGAEPRAAARARADRGRREGGARRPRSGRIRTTPAARARSRSSSRARTGSEEIPQPPRGRGPRRPH